MVAEHFPFTSDDPNTIAAHVPPVMAHLENIFEFLKSKLVGEPAEGINNIRNLVSAIPAGPKQGTLALQRLDKKNGYRTTITATAQETLFADATAKLSAMHSSADIVSGMVIATLRSHFDREEK